MVQSARPLDLQAAPGEASGMIGAGIAGRGKPFARALALLLLVVTTVLWVLDLPGRRELPYLNLAANLLFISVSSCLIAAIAVRSFRHAGSWPVLWLGAGSLMFGLAVFASSVLLTWLNADAAIAVHNLGALLAGSLHCVGAFFNANRIPSQEPGRPRQGALRQVYGVSLSAIVLLVAVASFGLLPTFFVQGQGGSPVRQTVLVVDVLLFVIAGLGFLRQYRRTRALMVYWYALGLLLTTIGLAGILLIDATGTALSWTARAAQWFGGLYLLVAALATLHDARARQQSPDEVLSSYFLRGEGNLKLLFDSILDAIIVTDTSARITGWNRGAEAIYGWRADEVLGRPVVEVLGVEYAPGQSMENAEQELAATGASRAELTQRHRDGRQLAILSTVSALKDAAGNAMGSVAINRDVSERRQADAEIGRLNARLAQRAAELEASNRELEAFAYSVSHDLRAPLRGIDGFSQALEEDAADQLDETGKGYLRMLRQNAQRMGQLIDDLLTLSRTGRQQLQLQTVRVDDLVRRAWEDLRPEWSGRPVELRTVGLSTARADPTLLRQVFANLLSNALKFSAGREQAIIEVGCRDSADGEQVYYVRDNGVGFDMHYVDKIFGVFQRLHRSEDYEGTGVGLAIVERIIQRHHGRAWAEGRPGEGACFYFTLGDAASEWID